MHLYLAGHVSRDGCLQNRLATSKYTLQGFESSVFVVACLKLEGLFHFPLGLLKLGTSTENFLQTANCILRRKSLMAGIILL
jgi:hypothetical protein